MVIEKYVVQLQQQYYIQYLEYGHDFHWKFVVGASNLSQDLFRETFQ